MEKILDGKTKVVFDVGDGNILLVFKDDVTGTGEMIDPGGNIVVGKIIGKGNASLRLTKHFFELLSGEKIPTHYIESDFAKGSMRVKKAETFGDGLEFICRLKAAGSFVRRYGKYVKEGDPLNSLVEITLKDDQQGDPLINAESIVQLGLMTTEEVTKAIEYTKRITGLIEKECELFKLELIDIKLEFGRIDGALAVIDEISGDNMRVRKNGKIVMQKEFCEIVCGQ